MNTPTKPVEQKARELLIDIFVAEGAAGSARQVRIDPEAHRPAINLIIAALNTDEERIRREAFAEVVSKLKEMPMPNLDYYMSVHRHHEAIVNLVSDMISTPSKEVGR